MIQLRCHLGSPNELYHHSPRTVHLDNRVDDQVLSELNGRVHRSTFSWKKIQEHYAPI